MLRERCTRTRSSSNTVSCFFLFGSETKPLSYDVLAIRGTRLELAYKYINAACRIRFYNCKAMLRSTKAV